MNEQDHLPMFGVGPYFMLPILFITITAIILSFYKKIPIYSINSINWPLTIIGIFIIAIGAITWLSATTISRIDKGIKENRLITTGIYGHVRHPIYSACLMLCLGLILISHNLILLILPIIYWIYLTVLMKNTEEQWLLKKYGKEYEEYSKRVNRCIPFIKIK